MKVRMLVSIAGHAEPLYKLPEFAFSPGDVVDVDKKLAAAWIEGGVAEKVVKAKDDLQETTEGSGANE